MPYYFDEFFASGQEETISPFLIPSSRKWSKNLRMRIACASAILLCVSFALSLFSPPFSHLFLIPVYFLSGTPALIGAMEDLKHLEINIDVLMTLAALLSLFIGSGKEGGLLLVLFELSAALESTVEHKTKSTLIHLKRLCPMKANVIKERGEIIESSLKEIEAGAKILIKAGEIVPLDGKVISGSSFVNLVHLTGETRPVSKSVGQEVAAGALNLDGTLTLEVTRASGDSTLSQIIRLILEAQAAKPRLQRLLNRFGDHYALFIIGLSFLFALFLPFLFSIPYRGSEGSIYRALTFLIAASPCALILSTPTAYLSAISSCSKRGILLKGSVIFDALANCSRVAFDKTGPLTTGKLSMDRMETLIPSEGIDETLALTLAATLERHALHPIGEALVAQAEKRGLPVLSLAHFKSIPGFGLEGRVDLPQKEIFLHIGNAAFLFEHLSSSLLEKWKEILPKLQEEKDMYTLLLAEGALFAFFFRDELRPSVPSLIEELKYEKLKIVMLTGDRRVNAEAVARLSGIDEFFADLTPEEKLRIVSEFSKKEGLSMVGDGLNDAPALARATVGISLGQIGSRTAIDAADVVFLHDEISLLPWLFRKAKMTLKIVKQNLSLALLVISLASVPALLGLVPLWLAVIIHEGGTILVGLNSLRLLKK